MNCWNFLRNLNGFQENINHCLVTWRNLSVLLMSRHLEIASTSTLLPGMSNALLLRRVCFVVI